MAALYLSARLFFRRMELLNIAALSALVILAARPSEISDASFLLSFSAVATIGALAVPWIATSSEPYLRGLGHLTGRDAAMYPRAASDSIPNGNARRGRMDFRASSSLCGAAWIRLVVRAASPLFIFGNSWSFRNPAARHASSACVLFSSRDAGRVPWRMFPPLLTGLAVPIGFFTLAASLVSHALAAFAREGSRIVLAMLDAPCNGLPVARRKLPHSGAAAGSHRTICRARDRACRGDSLAETLVAMGATTSPAGCSGAHRHVSLFAAHLSGAGPRIDRSGCWARGQPFSGISWRAYDAGGRGRRTWIIFIRAGCALESISAKKWFRRIYGRAGSSTSTSSPSRMRTRIISAVFPRFSKISASGNSGSGAIFNSAAYRHVLAAAREHGVRVLHRKQGESFDLKRRVGKHLVAGRLGRRPVREER
jgi:hypothetical protein